MPAEPRAALIQPNAQHHYDVTDGRPAVVVSDARHAAVELASAGVPADRGDGLGEVPYCSAEYTLKDIRRRELSARRRSGVKVTAGSTHSCAVDAGLASGDRVPEDLLERVLAKLGFSSKPVADRAGLEALYAAWCRGVPFDNTRKLIHLRANDPGAAAR